MNINIKLYIIIIITLVALTVCNRMVENTLDPVEYENLISNYSFEKNDVASIDGWQVETNVDSTIKFSDDVPHSGGRWSVVIMAADRVMARLRTTVAASTGTHVYRLTVWAKSKGKTGIVNFFLNKTIRKSITILDTTWTLYQITDTLSTIDRDSLSVELDGGVTYGINETFFDLCRLEKQSKKR